jgi:peptidyl-prolyl cis-trans isomerase D
VIEHKPSALQPFEQVKTVIEKKLVAQRASQLAAEEGRKQLDELRQGKAPAVSWSTPQLVSRADAKGITEPVLRQVFKADTKTLPSYTGVEAPGGGYMLMRVTRVVEPEKIDRAQQNSLSDGLAQMLGEEQFTAYISSLKQKQKVKINKEKFEKSQS